MSTLEDFHNEIYAKDTHADIDDDEFERVTFAKEIPPINGEDDTPRAREDNKIRFVQWAEKASLAYVNFYRHNNHKTTQNEYVETIEWILSILRNSLRYKMIRTLFESILSKFQYMVALSDLSRSYDFMFTLITFQYLVMPLLEVISARIRPSLGKTFKMAIVPKSDKCFPSAPLKENWHDYPTKKGKSLISWYKLVDRSADALLSKHGDSYSNNQRNAYVYRWFESFKVNKLEHLSKLNPKNEWVRYRYRKAMEYYNSFTRDDKVKTFYDKHSVDFWRWTEYKLSLGISDGVLEKLDRPPFNTVTKNVFQSPEEQERFLMYDYLPSIKEAYIILQIPEIAELREVPDNVLWMDANDVPFDYDNGINYSRSTFESYKVESDVCPRPTDLVDIIDSMFDMVKHGSHIPLCIVRNFARSSYRAGAPIGDEEIYASHAFVDSLRPPNAPKQDLTPEKFERLRDLDNNLMLKDMFVPSPPGAYVIAMGEAWFNKINLMGSIRKAMNGMLSVVGSGMMGWLLGPLIGRGVMANEFLTALSFFMKKVRITMRRHGQWVPKTKRIANDEYYILRLIFSTMLGCSKHFSRFSYDDVELMRNLCLSSKPVAHSIPDHVSAFLIQARMSMVSFTLLFCHLFGPMDVERISGYKWMLSHARDLMRQAPREILLPIIPVGEQMYLSVIPACHYFTCDMQFRDKRKCLFNKNDIRPKQRTDEERKDTINPSIAPIPPFSVLGGALERVVRMLPTLFNVSKMVYEGNKEAIHNLNRLLSIFGTSLLSYQK